MRQIEEVRSDGSYYSQNDLRIHFGLDRGTETETVEILWPSGTHDVKDLACNKLYVAEEARSSKRYRWTSRWDGALSGGKPYCSAKARRASL